MTMVMPAEIKAGEFKAKCLEIMDRVAETGESIVITKRGKPVAVLKPARDPSTTAAGFYSGKMEIIGDIMAPLEIEWGPAEPDLRPPRVRRRK